MKKYRIIRKVFANGRITYTPQVRLLGIFWCSLGLTKYDGFEPFCREDVLVAHRDIECHIKQTSAARLTQRDVLPYE